MLRLEVVSDRQRFHELQAAWQELWLRSRSHIFQHHGWLSAWIEGVPARKELRLRVALAWDDEQLVGAMPFVVQRRTGVRMLTWMAQLFNDYCDCLLDPAHNSTALLDALWGKTQQSGGFDIINLRQIRPDANCRPLLDRLCQTGGLLHLEARQEHCMRIDNHWADGAAFFRSLNKKARNNHTRGRRILEELGGEVAFSVLDPGAGPLEPVLDEILALKETWLRSVEPDSLLLGVDRSLHRAMLVAGLQSGLGKIFLLTCGGKIAAASINFDYHDRLEAYLTSYDMENERASPGTILIVEYAKWAFDRGLAHVDFLRGEEPFKFRMANAETLLSNFTGAKTLMGQLAVSGHRWLARRRGRVEAPKSIPEPEAV